MTIECPYRKEGVSITIASLSGGIGMLIAGVQVGVPAIYVRVSFLSSSPTNNRRGSLITSKVVKRGRINLQESTEITTIRS